MEAHGPDGAGDPGLLPVRHGGPLHHRGGPVCLCACLPVSELTAARRYCVQHYCAVRVPYSLPLSSSASLLCCQLRQRVARVFFTLTCSVFSTSIVVGAPPRLTSPRRSHFLSRVAAPGRVPLPPPILHIVLCPALLKTTLCCCCCCCCCCCLPRLIGMPGCVLCRQPARVRDKPGGGDRRPKGETTNTT